MPLRWSTPFQLPRVMSGTQDRLLLSTFQIRDLDCITFSWGQPSTVQFAVLAVSLSRFADKSALRDFGAETPSRRHLPDWCRSSSVDPYLYPVWLVFPDDKTSDRCRPRMTPSLETCQDRQVDERIKGWDVPAHETAALRVRPRAMPQMTRPFICDEGQFATHPWIPISRQKPVVDNYYCE